jgi:hypothetical protein
MNPIVKTAVAGALSLGASGAFALGLPSNNSSDLVLVIENTATLAAYALDTGITLDSLLPTGSLITGAKLNATLAGVNATIGPSSALAAFLAANPASGDAWVLEGGQYNGAGSSANTTNTKAAGAGKYAYTSNLAANQGTHSLGNLVTYMNGINGDVTNSTGGLFSLQSATESSTAAISANAIAKYGTTVGDTLSAMGASTTLFAFTGNNSTSTLQSYIMGAVSVAANGQLTIAGNGGSPPPVPLPAAVWLLGSGLMGLVGVSRRRKAAV